MSDIAFNTPALLHHYISYGLINYIDEKVAGVFNLDLNWLGLPVFPLKVSGIPLGLLASSINKN